MSNFDPFYLILYNEHFSHHYKSSENITLSNDTIFNCISFSEIDLMVPCYWAFKLLKASSIVNKQHSGYFMQKFLTDVLVHFVLF
jgi:hypothetical protein